ncbi:MAG: hypothetical protein ABI705_10335 [Aestuariivirga sp.]
MDLIKIVQPAPEAFVLKIHRESKEIEQNYEADPNFNKPIERHIHMPNMA